MLATLIFVDVLVASAFQAIIDTNTYNASELTYAASHFRCDGTWTISVNSPGVSDDLWRSALANIGSHAFSEDNPGSTSECMKVRNLHGGTEPLLATFQYHETGGQPHTMLSAPEIEAASTKCGNAGVIILTRAYWPSSEWKTNVEKVLSHPLLYGVAMEFNPGDYGKRNEGDFAKAVLAAGKSPFFLLPFKGDAGLPAAETRIKNAIINFASQGVDLKDPRVHIVLARYDQPHLPIAGSTNSIEAVLRQVLHLKSSQHFSNLTADATLV